MAKKILVMGLPGAGKTTLSKYLAKIINAVQVNADEVRKKANDWDFSLEGRRRRQENERFVKLLHFKGKNVVADFICPTKATRDDFDADFLIWVDTIKKGRFEDTNILFEPPENSDFRVTTQDGKYWSEKIAKIILKEKGYKVNFEKFLFSKVSTWVLLLVIIFFLSSHFFGALVLRSETAQKIVLIPKNIKIFFSEE